MEDRVTASAAFRASGLAFGISCFGILFAFPEHWQLAIVFGGLGAFFGVLSVIATKIEAG